MSNLDVKINEILNRFPVIKKVVKRTYQRTMYAFSKKIKFEGNIERVSPNDEYEYFFGYYDKSPWDSTNRYMLCLKVKDTSKNVAPSTQAKIILIDTENNNTVEVITKTNAWNVQQGCMLQWLEEVNDKIIFNDFRDNKYCSVILDIKTKEERVLEKPVYSISKDGKFALSLDFSRLHSFRKGYGYSNIDDKSKDIKCPDETAIWKIDLITGDIEPLFKYTDFYNFETREEMKDAFHKVNHIMISPNGKRFMVLHRWFKGSRKYTRLITVDLQTLEMYNLSDDDMTSHCFWKSDEEILAFAHKKGEGNGYFLMKDQTQEYKHLWTSLISDGHPSYSPNREMVITDTYPDRKRIASVILIKGDTINTVGRVFAPFKYDNDLRCDLHPRWDRKGEKVCFDSVFEGKRRLYTIDLGE